MNNKGLPALEQHAIKGADGPLFCHNNNNNSSNNNNTNIIMMWRHLTLNFFIFRFSPHNNNQHAARNRTLHARTADCCPQSLALFARRNRRVWSQTSTSNPLVQHLRTHHHHRASLHARLQASSYSPLPINSRDTSLCSAAFTPPRTCFENCLVCILIISPST